MESLPLAFLVVFGSFTLWALIGVIISRHVDDGGDSLLKFALYLFVSMLVGFVIYGLLGAVDALWSGTLLK